MKKHLFLLFVSAYALGVSAEVRVSLDELRSDWGRYANQTVVITTPLVVCGSYYDSLVLAPSRLFCPEERALGLADGDSTMYYQLADQNRASSIVVHCRNNYYAVRSGDMVRNLKARVTGERHLVTGRPVHTRHMSKDRLKRAKKGELRIVGANIENYFADLGGYAHPRTTPAQQAVQTRKLVKGLKKMHADIYALCEMQVGNKGPQMLLAALNKHGDKYAYVTLPLPDMDRIGGCFIYNKERVRACGNPLPAYSDTASHYHGRMFAQGFEQVNKKGEGNGKRFIISVNHFKSKRAGRLNYDTNIKRLSNADTLLASLPAAVEQYRDPDILLLGDYNCYSQEAPIQKIVRAGFREMLPLGGPGSYSYNYKGESGYLDRCFASPSMAEQVVRVRPWHINTDWYYSHGAYKMRDKSHHRYSDHDPIVVDVRLK